jgi:hypothetical protein
MTRLPWILAAACLILAVWALGTRHRRPDTGLPTDSVARVYDVADLIDAAPDDRDSPSPTATLGSAVGQTPRKPIVGSGGGIFSVGGGTLPTVSEDERLGELCAMIYSSVDAQAPITVFGRRLVIVQTRQNHALISSLLDDLRANPRRLVRIEAVWAVLRTADLDRLRPPGDAPARAVDLSALERLPAAIVYRGQATCVSGRQARITCGNARSVVVGLDAVVGANAAAYEARTQKVLDGATVDVTPSLTPDGATVVLDVRSEVTRWAPPGTPIELPAPLNTTASPTGLVKLDRLNFGVQSISASARGPAGAAILVGGTTDAGAAADDGRQLFLIIRTTELKRGTTPTPPKKR